MSKWICSTILGASLVLTLSCGSSPHSPAEKYFLVATNVKLPYWQQAGAGLARAATQMKVSAELVGPDSYDPKAQHESFLKALQKKPVGILLSAGDPTIMKADVDEAIAQGIPVVTIDSDVPGAKRLVFIGTDNYSAGLMGGKLAAERLHGKGNVVVYTMPEQKNLMERLQGYKEAFSRYPGIKIVETVDIKGDPRIAFDRTTDLLDKGPKPDGFVCLEAIACPEVAEVLERKKVTGAIVVAMDTDQRTLEGIQKGTITATIGQKPFTMAYYGLKVVDDLHHNPPSSLSKDWSKDSFSPLPTFIDTGATLIDKSNVDEFIQQRNSNTSK